MAEPTPAVIEAARAYLLRRGYYLPRTTDYGLFNEAAELAAAFAEATLRDARHEFEMQCCLAPYEDEYGEHSCAMEDKCRFAQVAERARREERERCAQIAESEALEMSAGMKHSLSDDKACWLWARQTAEHIEKAIRALTPPSQAKEGTG